MVELTVIQVVNKCKELQEAYGKEWFFKANKGTIKLGCLENE